MRISDWSSDVCSSDLLLRHAGARKRAFGLIGEPDGERVDRAFARGRNRSAMFGHLRLKRRKPRRIGGLVSREKPVSRTHRHLLAASVRWVAGPQRERHPGLDTAGGGRPPG